MACDSDRYEKYENCCELESNPCLRVEEDDFTCDEDSPFNKAHLNEDVTDVYQRLQEEKSGFNENRHFPFPSQSLLSPNRPECSKSIDLASNDKFDGFISGNSDFSFNELDRDRIDAATHCENTDDKLKSNFNNEASGKAGMMYGGTAGHSRWQASTDSWWSDNATLNSKKKKSPLFARYSKARKIKKFKRKAKADYSDFKDTPYPGKIDRSRSYQFSSIRVLNPLESRKSEKKLSKNVDYGQRIILKNGNSNIVVSDQKNRVELYSRYVSDIFTTLLDSSWKMVLAVTAIVFITHWLLFGLMYWLFAVWNNDHAKHEEYLLQQANSSVNSSSFSQEMPCVYHVYDVVSAFLFSLESETTIGYGFRTITTQCPAAVACLALQCIVSAVFDTWVIGMCFARLARPDARAMTTLFSKMAVVCQRDGERCLLFRFANLRKSLLLNVSVTGRLITWRAAHTKEKRIGLQRMLEQRQITFHNESSALLTAPIEYCHVINEKSPLNDFHPSLYNSPDQKNHFELICVVTGTLESTGLTMHAQTSYLSSEILYGHRFLPALSKCPDIRRYVVDFQNFHSTWPEPHWVGNQKNKTIRFCDTSEGLIEEVEDEEEESISNYGETATIESVV